MFDNRVSTFGIVVLALALGLSSANAKPVVFNFENQAFGSVTPLSIDSGRLTATFTALSDPGSFQIGGALYLTLTGNYLTSPGDTFQAGEPLTIAFSLPIRSISLNFAVDTQPALAPLTLMTDGGGTVSAKGTIPGGFFFYPEGVLSYDSRAFRSVTLSTSALSFAIDNISVEIPEPESWAVLCVAVAGAGLSRRLDFRSSV